MRPIFFIYLGMTGAGKTTLFEHEGIGRDVDYINPDLIAKQNNWDWRSRADNIKAGMIALERINKDIENQKTLAIETTAVPWKLINKARENGFYIDIKMIVAESVDLARERIATRVSQGGHGISEEKMVASFRRQEKNIKESIKQADHFVIYRNADKFRKVAEFNNSKPLYIQSGETLIKKCYNEVLEEQQGLKV